MPLKREKIINIFTQVSTIAAWLLSCQADQPRLRHSCDLRLRWNFPVFLKWSDCSGQAVRNSERVYTGPKEMENLHRAIPSYESRLSCTCSKTSLPVYYVRHSDSVRRPVLPNGRRIPAGQISWLVWTIFRSSLFMDSELLCDIRSSLNDSLTDF